MKNWGMKNGCRLSGLGMAGLVGFCLAWGLGTAHAQTNASTTQQPDAPRYVWASGLNLRAEPDAKGKSITRLPYGAAVTLRPVTAPVVAHKETLFKLKAEPDSPAADVTLEGNWVPVRFQEQDGWVFDAYLMRYPAPVFPKDKDSEFELKFAKKIFGVQRTQAWAGTAAKTGESYRTMRKMHPTLKDEELFQDADWNYIDFKNGAHYERLVYQASGIAFASDDTFSNLPMSFNEAVVWAVQFGYFNKDSDSGSATGFDKFSGEFQAGRRLHVGPGETFPEGFAFGRLIECAQQTCSIRYSFMD